ncbi:hypothetical protein [Bacillus thuringiensis]|uniref:hypothetical protein n=1 Tax=Bacillus thuringiensis TaxID=1428 RepID=UPI000BFBC3FB|nr:hypothetical protein [Bacillus thuringiensis]PGT90056.1 hypothetical protein COD17_09915 [Bacillus thuringiensis]
MSIRKDFGRLIDFYRKKNKEANVERSVVKNSIVENEFYSEYSSFTAGLQEMLDKHLGDGKYKEVVYEPSKPEHAKYFVAVMDDPQFSPYYHMSKTVGGEFIFRLKDFEEMFDGDDEEVELQTV